MLGNKVPILISDGVDEIIATRNPDKTYRVTTCVRVQQADGQEIAASVEISRAFLHIEALYDGEELYKLVVPTEEVIQVDFPAPSQEEWELLGLKSPKEE